MYYSRYPYDRYRYDYNRYRYDYDRYRDFYYNTQYGRIDQNLINYGYMSNVNQIANLYQYMSDLYRPR